MSKGRKLVGSFGSCRCSGQVATASVFLVRATAGFESADGLDLLVTGPALNKAT